MAKPIIMPSMNVRTLLALAHDMVASAVTWPLAFWLRFNLDIPQAYSAVLWSTLVWVVPLQSVIFLYFGLYRGIWRYASLPDLKRIAIAVAAAGVAVPALLFLFRVPDVPRSVLIIDPLLLILVMGGSRLAYRGWKERRIRLQAGDQARPALVLGAGDAASALLRELASSSEWKVVGLLDDNRARHGRQVYGVSVLGGFEDVGRWSMQLAVEDVIIAMPSASHLTRRRALDLAQNAGLRVMTVPSYQDLVGGKVTVSQIRPVELEDLLGRDPVVLDLPGLNEWLHDRVAMVTGAGGSIGSELCRQIVPFKPAKIVLFDHSEFALYQIEQEFRRQWPEIEIASVIGDVKSRTRLTQLMRDHRPSVIFHAAAYKHVPLMEEHNAWQAITNNVLGTYTVAQAAIEAKVEKMVLISTDKAVNPTSIMGASKRLAELVCLSLQQRFGTGFVIVRFGNVLGSAGSVVPKFRAQIASGGPVTVTHPEVRRYFMSIPEATQLVLQAGLMGKGGEIYLLDMGELIRIADLARDLIRLSGFGEDEIKIVFTGLRPGEKLYEEVLATDENSLPTPHPKLRIAQATAENRDWLNGLLKWVDRDVVLDDASVKAEISRWVREYSSPEQHRAKHSSDLNVARIRSLHG